jgi:serine/threonine protein kinase
MYYFESAVGTGAFGNISRVRRLHDWAIFAAKEIKKVTKGSDGKKVMDDGTFEKEMRALRSLKHERIVKFVDRYEDKGNEWVLVMDYCHYGSLLRVLSTRTSTDEPLTGREATEIMKQVAEGLVYLHNQGVTHRDLKPANILVRSLNPLSLALSDFGLAKADDSKMHTLCGTRQYIAPDMYIPGRSYTKAVDIWALGVVGINLFMGDLPDLVIT